MPLVVSFILLCGIRGLLAVPVDVRANWVFRLLADNRHLPALVAGVRTALMLLVVVPAAVVAVVSTWRRGVLFSIGHAAFASVMGVLLLDALLFHARALPFVAAGRTGGAHLGSRWPLYLAAFSLYCYSLARLELWLLTLPIAWCLVVAAAVATSLFLTRLRRLDLSPPRGLEYGAADDDQLFGGFGLSEALAARSTPSRPSARCHPGPRRSGRIRDAATGRPPA